MRFLRAAADAPAKLMKLRQAKSLCMFDDHHGGVRHIDSYFHDGSRHEDLHFVTVEALHDIVLLLARKPPMQQPQLQLGENFFRKLFVLVDGCFQLELGFLDDRINDVALAPRGDFAPERFPNAGKMLLGGHARDDRGAAGRQFIQHGNVQVAIKSERQRPRNRCGGEHQDVGRVPMERGLVHESFALQHAETVLLVNGHKAKPRECHVFFDQRVRAHYELRFTRFDALEGCLLFRALETADEQLDTIARFAEDAPRGKKMLNRENLRGRHERSLRAVLDGDHRGLQSNDSLPATDIALQQSVHRRGLLQVRDNFLQDALLRLRGLERQNALQRFAYGIFAHTKSDGVFFARGPPVQAQAQLVQKEFLENEPLLRGRAERVERVERLRRLRKVCMNESFAA